MESRFSGKYMDDLYALEQMLRTGKSYDIITKKIKVADKKATLYCVDAFIKEEVLEKMFEYFTKLSPEDLKNISTADSLNDNYLTYIECDTVNTVNEAVIKVLSGSTVMIVEDITGAVIIDARTYPARSVSEPESDKVLRGSHEGFVETLVFNTALIRRKIRDPNLTMELFTVGERSKTDIVLCYLEDKADPKKLNMLQDKLRSIRVESLPMSQESLKECLVPSQIWNPFPKVRYTERPDTASACVYDGNIIILVDGSPSAMIVPTGIFDFIQDINDYYFSPATGAFLRYVRILVFSLSMLLTPVWFLLIKNPVWIPDWLEFIIIDQPYSVPVFAQLLVVEFVIDALKLASMSTPSALSNSFSVVAALVLGEFAVSSGLFSAEVVLFMAFVAIANFTQPSFELGYAIKLFRLLLILLVAAFNLWGFIGGMVLIALTVCFTKTIDGYTYLYPLYPFNKEALRSLFIRRNVVVNYDVKE
ncbi:MAG: spore germination protein [Clostridia bacterium]|nr:spore germination protein [Clostridia bacterium]